MTKQSKQIKTKKLHYQPTKKDTIKMTPKLKALAKQNYLQEITGANISTSITTTKGNIFTKLKSWL